MSKYTPKTPPKNCYCKKTQLALAKPCEPANCHKCGWNPEVHKERLEALHRMSSRGKLRDWGK